MKLWLKVLLVIVSVAYPFAIYFGAKTFSPRYLVLLLVLVVVLRVVSWRAQSEEQPQLFPKWWLLLVLVLVATSAVGNTDLGLRLYPVAVSASFLLAFASSLSQPQTFVERLARLTEPNLPPAAVVYTRRVTQVWCVFFVLNATIAAYTALFSSFDWWLLYNGLISYLLIGGLMGGEFMVRCYLRATDIRYRPVATSVSTSAPNPGQAAE